AAPRYRIIIPLSRPVDPEEYRELALRLMDELGEQYFDPAGAKASQYMFRPAVPEGTVMDRWVVDGPALDPDAELADWDRSLVRRAHRAGVRMRDPLALSGAVGAFNRVYTIDQAVEAYDLPYVREGDRLKLKGSRSQA